MTILTYDIGGTQLKAGLARDGALLATAAIPTSQSEIVDELTTQLIEIGTGLLRGERPDAIGISVRGVVDPESGMVADVNRPLRCLIGTPLATRLSTEFNAPARVENDGRLHGIGEMLFGAARGESNVVCITLGTGVGTSVMIDGRVLRGARGRLGILGGHFTVDRLGPRCTCGNVGCLEALIGAEALVTHTRELCLSAPSPVLNPDALDPAAIFTAAAGGDETAGRAVARFEQALGCGVVTFIHAYDPDLILFGGGLSTSADVFLPAVKRYVDAHAWTLPRGRVRLERAALHETAALLGAAALATDDPRTRS